MSVLVLGTASHVGKSVTVAAICRALVRKGIPVAPFKSQNMSLNSYVTPEGGEIGMAQAMQAFAAKLPPHTDMNPILLKPKGDGVSQVVLCGRPYKDVPITEYYRETDRLLETAVECYRRLEKKYGNVVGEGAGGAAELNLYDRDIANIRLARALSIPIILVADIERGGVFAQCYGTIALLPEDIRPLVKGIIINKFRGDIGIFKGGAEQIEEITGVRVLGVVPYFDLPLPSEDSLSLGDKKQAARGVAMSGGTQKTDVRIAVIHLPHISNFTDFELLERYGTVEYVPLGKPLAGFDCIIIPGTKNTVDDLIRVIRTGTAAEIQRARKDGIPIIGICGGYQMLGAQVIDEGFESDAGEGAYPALGLLAGTTHFSSYEKVTKQVVRQAKPVPPILSGIGEVTGYEIHMGETDRGLDPEAFGGDGAVSRDGLVFGTYLHGLFQNESAVHALLRYLAGKNGGVFTPGCAAGAGEQDPYDTLADLYEQHVDMNAILRFFPGNRD
ncbi:MAG: cobyric acid synthase [Methanoregulaceae archaeon]